MPPSRPIPVRNRLLAALPPDTLAQLMPKFRRVPLVLRDVLCPPDAALEAVYFPEAGMVSMVAVLEEGMQAEVGLIGFEGMLGLSALSGNPVSFVEAVVQLSGTAWCMDIREFRGELDASAELRAMLLRYNDAQLSQVMQTAACNGRHDLEQRLARWLLMVHDRTPGDEMLLTQEFMAVMLGVHRPSITVTAGILQRAGLIRYAKGCVTVLDRASLEAASCECYRAVTRRYAMLFPPPP
ncbi:MAG: Crp/Fnr family transcriptional regulator [Janthinobacterium lividum]